MFKKISYITMVSSVLLSWGALIYIAQSQDMATAEDNRKALLAESSAIAQAGTEIRSYIPRKTMASAAVSEELARAKLKPAPKTRTVK